MINVGRKDVVTVVLVLMRARTRLFYFEVFFMCAEVVRFDLCRFD